MKRVTYTTAEQVSIVKSFFEERDELSYIPENAAGIPNLRPVVQEVGFSVIGVVPYNRKLNVSPLCS